MRAIFFYYMDIIQWSNTLPLDQESSQASSKTHSSPYIWINTGSGLQSILNVREGENHSLSLKGLSTRDENTSIIGRKTSGVLKIFFQVCLCFAILSLEA